MYVIKHEFEILKATWISLISIWKQNFHKEDHTVLCYSKIKIFMPPLKNGAYCFATVGRYVSLSVCRPSVVNSISFDPFTWSIPNLVQGLPSMSRWSLLIFRSHVQRSRSHHSFRPLCCLLNIFWSLHLINTTLGAGVAPNK